MPLLKYWTGNMPNSVRLQETSIDPKRVTSIAPSSNLQALTAQERETKKLAVEQQKLQRIIKTTKQKVASAHSKRSLEDSDDEDEMESEFSDDDASAGEDYSCEEEQPASKLTKAQIRAEEKLQELNNINRDIQKTACRTRVINKIKAESERRKQQALKEQNAALKNVLLKKQSQKRQQNKTKMQKKKKELALQFDVNETRMSNVENVLQNVLEEQQKSKSKKKKRKPSRKTSDSEESTSETPSSSSEEETEEKSDAEKNKKKRRQPEKKQKDKKVKKEKSSKENYNYGSLGNFIKSINK